MGAWLWHFACELRLFPRRSLLFAIHSFQTWCELASGFGSGFFSGAAASFFTTTKYLFLLSRLRLRSTAIKGEVWTEVELDMKRVGGLDEEWRQKMKTDLTVAAAALGFWFGWNLPFSAVVIFCQKRQLKCRWHKKLYQFSHYFFPLSFLNAIFWPRHSHSNLRKPSDFLEALGSCGGENCSPGTIRKVSFFLPFFNSLKFSGLPNYTRISEVALNLRFNCTYQLGKDLSAKEWQ